MVCDDVSGFPLAILPNEVNEINTKDDIQMIDEFMEKMPYLSNYGIFKMNSSFYTVKSIKDASNTCKWLVRMPKTLKFYKDIEKQSYQAKYSTINENIAYCEVVAEYAETPQRFIIVIDQEDLKTSTKKYNNTWMKKSEKAIATHRELYDRTFKTKNEAEKVLKKQKFVGDVEWLEVNQNGQTAYKINIATASNIDDKRKNESNISFILATNELDIEKAPSEQLVKNNIRNVFVERGFRFRHDGNIDVQLLFVEKEERVYSLMFIFTLCLMVFSEMEDR